MTDVAVPMTSRKDWASDQEVRWCPGCGDYTILSAVQLLLPELGVRRENTVFVSGIGCAARFPYYMNTYGMHSIHGRAPAIATGLAVTRPDLDVWVVTGDGDSLSIGGNHLIHALRRNVKLTILMFNNQIYGLTKGQYSPTSEVGKITKSTPFGSLDTPFNPVSLALGAEATFVARTHDLDRKHMIETFRRAHDHPGASFVEVYQNCNVFNDGAFDAITGKEHRAEMLIPLEHGQADPFRGRGRARRRFRRAGPAAPRRGGRRRRGRAARPRRAATRPEPGLRVVPSRDRAARADTDRRLPGGRAPDYGCPRRPPAPRGAEAQGPWRSVCSAAFRSDLDLRVMLRVAQSSSDRNAMPVRGLGSKNVVFGGIRRPPCATRSILLTGTGLSRNPASARPVTHGRDGFPPARLVGELVVSERRQHHLQTARVEVVLGGLFEGRERMEEPEAVPRHQAHDALRCRRREVAKVRRRRLDP